MREDRYRRIEHSIRSIQDDIRLQKYERLQRGGGGEEGIRTLDTALDRITV